jgi:hypothetical protein
VQCPSPIGTVRDLRRSVLATDGGRSRTNSNETEIETVPVFSSADIRRLSGEHV